MARKSNEPDPLQGSVFDQEALLNNALADLPTPTYEPSLALPDHEPTLRSVPQTVNGKEFSAVDLVERAELLCEALGAFGLRNQRLGFDYASNTGPHDGPIWGRYKSKTPRVQEGAQANSERFRSQAEAAFLKATGITAMRGKGFGSDDELDAAERKLWRDFSAKYEHAESRAKRDKYIKRLKRVIKSASKSESAAA